MHNCTRTRVIGGAGCVRCKEPRRYATIRAFDFRPMPIPALLLVTAGRWFSSARMPCALAKAGFEPSLLAPRGSLAERSALLSKVGHLPESNDLPQWVFAL